MKELLISALRTSGNILLQYFNKPLTVSEKESQSSIVTEADIESETKIISMISKEFSAHNILSEERGFIDNNSEYTWVVDPLDGTSNFAAGIPWFGVLITLFKDNEPVMAGAYLPVQDILYFAESGRGAFINEQRLPFPGEKELKNSLFSFCIDYSDDKELLKKSMDIYLYLLRSTRNIRSTNCLIDFLYVAEGKFGGLINLFTRVWDISGLGLIISEAGGIMKNINGTNISFTIKEEIIYKNFPVIAGTPKIVESVLTGNNLY